MEIQIKIIMKYHFTAVRIVKIKRTTSNGSKDMEQLDLYAVLSFEKPFIIKLNILLNYDPEFLLFSIYSRNIKTCPQKVYIRLFIENNPNVHQTGELLTHIQ